MAGTAQDPPALKRIIYDGSVIQSSWDPATGSGKLFVITLFEDGSSKTSAQGYDRSGMLPVDRKNLDLAKTYTVKVAESDASLNPVGPYSNAIVLIPEAPSTVKADYDGVQITVSFTPPETAVEIEGGKLSLFEKSQSKLIQSVDFEGDSFIFKPSPPLTPSTGYFITVVCENPGSLGPASGPAEIVQDTLEIANVAYDGQTIKATASQTAPDPYMLVLRLYADGRFVENAIGKGNEVTLTPQDKLVLWKRYEVRLARFIENSCGPFSAPMPVLSATPVLQGVSYDGAYLKASWQDLPGHPVPTGGALMVFQDETLVQSFDAQGNSACVQLPSALPDNKQNKLRVAATYGPSRGALSQPLDIITSVKQLTSAQYDGERITAAWPSGTGFGVTGYLLSLLENGIEVIKQNAGGTTGTINYRLNPNSNYSLSLQGTGYNTVGPDGANPLISAIPGIRTVVAKPDSITVELDVLTPSPNVTGYVAYLYQGNNVVAGPVAAAGSPLTAVFNYTVAQQYNYSVKVQATGGNCSGPLSEAVNVISGVPVIEEILYDGLNASISWSTVRGAAVTGYSLHLEDKSSGAVQTFPTPLTIISIPVDKSKSCSVLVQAAGDKSAGILSQSVDIINETASIASAYYDGEFIRSAWPAATTPDAAYEVLLLDGNDVSDSFTVTANSAAIPAVLNPTGAYSLKLRLAVDGVTGPGGLSFPVVSAVPGIVSTTAGGDNVSVVIDDSACNGKPGYTGCQAVLYRDCDIVAGPVAAAGSPLTAVFNYTVAQQYNYSVKVQAAGSSCSGPWSDAAGVIAGIPVIDTINYDELTAFISWSTVLQDSVTGYTVTLKEKSGGFKQNFTTAGTSISIPVDRTRNFSVQVQARSSCSLGRFSDAVDIIHESIELTSVIYDGEIIVASWPAASTPGVSYIALLMDGDDLKGSHHTSTNSLIIPAFLDQGGSYSLKLRLHRDNVVGPYGSAFPVVSSAPGIVSVVASADRVTVVIDDSACRGKPGINVCQAILCRGVDPAAGPVDASGSPLTASFDYAVSPQYGYDVKVRAAGQNCSGPWSADTAVIPAAPEIIEAVYSGSNIMVDWTPLATCPVTGYATTLTPADDVSKAVTVYSSGTCAAIPFDASGASGAYTVSVRALCDSSSGPASAPVDPIGPGLCFSSEKDKAPAVKPASNSLPPTPIEVACLLPELYKTPPSTLPSEGPFALTPLEGAGDLKYKIAFQPNSDVWSFDSSPLRAAIQQQYTKFLSALEGKLPDQPPPTIGTLLPGAVQTVIESLARVMPQTFAETLYYNYGFYATYNYADLRPGMRLRLEYEQWQTVSSQSSGTTQYFNGYTGNTVAEYDIGSFTDSMGKQRVGFNSFLSNLDGLLVPTPKGSGAGPMDGGGGNIDFLFREFQQPFYRLFYPSTFKAPYEQGSCFPKDNAMIVAAADWTTLESITSAIIAGRGSSLPAIGANYAMFYLRGRTVMTPLISLTLNGARIWTPVGTTLSQLMEQSAVKPLIISSTITGLRYLRVWGGNYGPVSQGLNFNIGRRLPIRFQWGASTVYANFSNWFSLPVLHGDVVEFVEERA